MSGRKGIGPRVDELPQFPQDEPIEPPMGLINFLMTIGVIVFAYGVVALLWWGVARAIDMGQAVW